MRRFLLVALALLAAIYMWNASWLAAAPQNPQTRLIAHRGVHQTFDRTNLLADTCTAERIFEPTHELLENTLVSMEAAFAASADVVEIDIALTSDDRFADFHDWTIDCRTQGSGNTRDFNLPYLQSLDIGNGYTSDHGSTYPLRGKGTGQMPSLKDVLSKFADKQFLINFKSRDAREGDILAHILSENPRWRDAVWGVYGGDTPTHRAIELVDGLKGFGVREMKDCLIKYFALGWSGYVPEPCQNTYVMIPGNLAWALWGWPNRFHARMQSVGSKIILLGPYSSGDAGSSGIDSLEQVDLVPDNFDGYLWTNRIELIGPELATLTAG